MAYKTSPTLIIFAGANGSGKTTAAENLLPQTGVREFVNADEIARGLSPLDPGGQKITAGKLFLKRIDDLLARKKSFAFETTLSGKIHLSLIEKAKEIDYEILLYYIYTSDPSINLYRVKGRVEQGGHNVPDEDVMRRYYRSLNNLVHAYMPVCDKMVVLDVSKRKMTEICRKHGNSIVLANAEAWAKILKDADKMNNEEDIPYLDLIKGAPLLALKKARMYGTKLAIKQNGKVILETPDEFEKHLRDDDLKS